MYCHQPFKHDLGHPFDLFFLKLSLRPRVQYVVEVVSKIFIYYDFLIRNGVDYLSKGVMITKISVKSVDLGVKRLIVMKLFENYVLLIIAVEH